MPTAPTVTARTGHGVANGTCGELLQGVLPGGRRFHVTCPIRNGSAVTVTVTPSSAVAVHGLPPSAAKTERALRLTAELLELGPVSIRVDRSTDLPAAKGMASSTADVIAASRALARAAGQRLDPVALARLATSIEASDGVMYDEVVAFDQFDGTLLHRWAWSPAFTIAMFIPESGRVTSGVTFDGLPLRADAYAGLLADLDDAMVRHDHDGVARVSTRSAELNEAFVPNPLFRVARPMLGRIGALGLCVGHTGTVCGLLFPPSDDGQRRAQACVERLLPLLPAKTMARMTRMV